MQVRFSKYQGTGNDFIIIDCLKSPLNLTSSQIRFLCDRRFGIGADGLMTLDPSKQFDFKMSYYNADGNKGSMCGNGGRCIVSFAQEKKYIGTTASFEAYDGLHHAEIRKDGKQSIVSLMMNDVNEIEKIEHDIFLNTGSPHYVVFQNNIKTMDVVAEGRKIRYNERFKADGTNVNFVSVSGDRLNIRSYERGVEDETLSCGTGVTASVVAAAYSGKIKNDGHCNVQTMGGGLEVQYKRDGNKFTNVKLIGSAEFVFEGEIEL